MEKMAKGSWVFKAEASEDSIRNFLQEFIDGGYLVLHKIRACDVLNADYTPTGESVMVAEFSTTESNLKQFQKEFGGLSTIREGWDNYL